MPAIDLCEPQVIRALEKGRWVVTHQPYAIRIHESKSWYIYADARLTQPQNRGTIIVTEVKCFAESRPLLDEFYHAVGQYVSYRSALALNALPGVVYLAVPSSTYSTFFQEPFVQSVIRDVQMKLVMIDLEQEEIVTWIS